MDRLDTPFLPSFNLVEEKKFSTTASSLKLWFYFMICVFPLAVEFAVRSGHEVALESLTKVRGAL